MLGHTSSHARLSYSSAGASLSTSTPYTSSTLRVYLRRTSSGTCAKRQKGRQPEFGQSGSVELCCCTEKMRGLVALFNICLREASSEKGRAGPWRAAWGSGGREEPEDEHVGQDESLETEFQAQHRGLREREQVTREAPLDGLGAALLDENVALAQDRDVHDGLFRPHR
eukprot:1413941-Rhodomonas_salina.1